MQGKELNKYWNQLPIYQHVEDTERDAIDHITFNYEARTSLVFNQMEYHSINNRGWVWNTYKRDKEALFKRYKVLRNWKNER